MPKKAVELSPLAVKRLTSRNGLHFVGGVPGLALQVSGASGDTDAGATSWVLRATIGGKRRDMGLGGYPSVGLSDARNAAREARAKIRQGIDPISEVRAARAALASSHATRRTFEQAARAYIELKQSEWKNAKHRDQWANTLATYAYPIIGSLPVSEICQAHVMRVLQPIWNTKTETATRLRGRIESVLDWATASGFRPKGENPARWRGHLDKLLPTPSKIAKVDHHEALPFIEMGAFMSRLRSHDGVGARALEFAILTAARSGEVRLGTWGEIDFKAKVWSIPGNRMKAGKEHRVPLSTAAIALLESLPRRENVDFIFANNAGKPLSDMTLTQQLRRMGLTVTAHGFRSTFRDWAGEKTNFPREVCEMALAHTIGSKVELAYLRSDFFEKRRRLMAAWATYCEN